VNPLEAVDLFLGSSDSRGDFARARAAFARARLVGPNNGEYLWIRVDPPVIGQPFGRGEKDVHDLIVSPHLQGSTLFPVSGFPLYVYIYVALTDRVFEELRFEKEDVSMAAWGELYLTFEAAAAAALWTYERQNWKTHISVDCDHIQPRVCSDGL
jgi:hypothetical protein